MEARAAGVFLGVGEAAVSCSGMQGVQIAEIVSLLFSNVGLLGILEYIEMRENPEMLEGLGILGNPEVPDYLGAVGGAIGRAPLQFG